MYRKHALISKVKNSRKPTDVTNKFHRDNVALIGEEQPVTLSTRRPTFGATAEEEYLEARSKAFARVELKRVAVNNNEGDIPEPNETSAKSNNLVYKKPYVSDEYEEHVSLEELKERMQVLYSRISTKATETIHEIDAVFDKCQKILEKRREFLIEQVVKSKNSLENNIKLEYDSVGTNWNKASSTFSNLEKPNKYFNTNVAPDMNYLSADYKFFWSSCKLEDMIEEFDSSTVVTLTSMAPHKTQVQYGVGGVGHVYRLSVITFTPQGNRCKSGGMTFKACAYSTVKKRALDCDVIDNSNGTYQVRFLPCHAGTYKVSMRIGEESQLSMEVAVHVHELVATVNPAFVNIKSQAYIHFQDTSRKMSSISACILSHEGEVLDTYCTLENDSMLVSYTPLSAQPHTLLVRSSTGDVIGSFCIPVGKMTFKHVFANIESSVTVEHVDIAEMGIHLETPDGQDVPIVYMGGEIGIQTYKFIPEDKGILKLEVKSGDNISSWTNIQVGSLVVDVKSAVVNGRCTVGIDACDCSGFLLKDTMEDIEVTAQLSGPDGSMEPCDIEFHNGSWQISYIPQSVGCYHLVFFLDGVVYRGSPIRIEVNRHLEIYGGPSSEFFGRASDICTSADRHTFIADTAENNRIVILDPDCRFHSSIPVHTKDVSLITINYCGTKLYVLYIVKKVMEVYDINTHKCVLSADMNDMGAPSSLVLNRNDNTLLISDTEKKCVFVIDTENCKEDYRITPIGVTLQWPSDLCVDDNGTMYVCDTDAGKIVVMDKRGIVIGKPFGGESGIKDPVAVAIDHDNRLLVLLRAQQMCLFDNDRKLLGILKTGGAISRRSKIQIMLDGYFIKTNERENCLRKYHYGSIEKSTTSDIRDLQRRSGRPRGRLFPSSGSLLTSSRSESTSPDSLYRLLCFPFQFPGQHRKSRSCLDLSQLENGD